MIRKFIAAFMMMFFVMSSTAFAAEKELKAGDVIRVQGVGTGPKNWDKKDSFYKTYARQAARMDALRQIAEIISEQLNELIVESYRKANRVIVKISQDSRAFKIIEKNARVIDGGELDGGGYFVTMELILPDDWKK